MVAEHAAGPSQVEEARQASVQELQSLRDLLSQAEARNKELEAQLESTNKVKFHRPILQTRVIFGPQLSDIVIILRDAIACDFKPLSRVIAQLQE